MAHLQPQVTRLSKRDFKFDSRRELGTGSFSRVYAVEYHDTEVAVKVTHEQPESEEEINNMARIAHRNVAGFVGTVEYDNRTCVVLELAPRGSVRDILQSGHVDLLRSARPGWICDIARGLTYLHHDIDPSMIHGDVKSGNILIFDVPDGRTVAKISDFGESRSITGTTSVRHIGSQLWSAPEILADECASLKSDVWSFGAVVTEMFTEEVPYHHKHHNDFRKMRRTIRMVEDKELDPLTDLQVTWPQPIFKVVRECFQRDYKNRPTIKEVLRQLEREPLGASASETTGSPHVSFRVVRLDDDNLHKIPQFIHLSVFNPDGEAESRSVELKEGQETFGEALSSARASFQRVPISSSPLCFSQEAEYRRISERRRSVWVYDPDGDRSLYIDIEDGEEVEPDSRTSVIRRFLCDRSPVPTSPRCLPAITIENNAALMTISADRKEAKVASPEALRQEEFCAFLEGIGFFEGQPQFFWGIRANGPGEEFVGPSGQVIQGRGAITGPRQRMFVLPLLRSGDPLPFIPLPEGRNVQVFHRLGAKVTVKDGRLAASTARSPCDVERWTTTAEVTDFIRKTSAVARKK